MLSPEDAHHMFDKLLRQANPVPQRILDAFLAALSHAPSSDACRDGPALAVALFNRVYREKGLQVAPLSVYTYSIVMDCCRHSRRPDLGLAIFGRLLRMGLKTVQIIANNVLNFLCYTKSTDEAVNVLLHRMSELGCAPNYLSYSIVVKGLCDNGRSQQALDLLQLVVKEGVTCSLSVVQYNMVIKSFFKEGEVSKACNLFHRMPELGCAPSAFSYSIVAKGLCDDGRSQQALDLLQMAVKEGGTCSLSVVIYNTVIDGFFKEGEVSKAFHLFHEMKKQGFMPNVVTYTSVIDASCKARAMDKAELFLRQMIDNGVQPDVVTYNSMIHGYSTLGQWKEASKMFREMKSQGLRPDIITWRSLITPLHKHGRHHEAAGVFDSMTAKCHAPQT
uniref:Uncharacterized protein n=1 Tax=Avena sativa TaxID=4498 RepID=A0ACD5ZHF6_AVESA